MAWIDHAGTIRPGEPQLPIRRLGDQRSVADRSRGDPDTVIAIEGGDLDLPGRISAIHRGCPPVQLRPRDANERAWHLQPDRVRMVFDRPMDAVAREAVSAGQPCDAALLQSAQAARGGDPEGAVWLQSQAADQTIADHARSVRFTDLTVLQIGDAAFGES